MAIDTIFLVWHQAPYTGALIILRAENAVENPLSAAYYGRMIEKSDTRRPAPRQWIDALVQARDDVAAGRTVPAATVHEVLRKNRAALQSEAAALEGVAARER
jgi:hypothetical protein